MSDSRLRLRAGRFALLELLSMFLGVFLAFAFDNYREDQDKLRREQEYLSALACEVNDEVLELLRVDSIYTDKAERMKLFFRTARESSARLDSLNDLFKAFMFRYPFPGQFHSVYESMKTSGDLSLVHDKIFVQQLVRHNQSREELVDQGRMLLNELTQSFHGFMRPRYDYRQRIPYDLALLRSRELLSNANWQQGSVRDYADVLGIHLARTLELQQALSGKGGCK
jgi:hypothetical protein